MGGFAWVTLATNDSYSLGALVLAHSLKRVNTAHQLAILITPGVTEAMRTQLSAVFNVVKEVDVLDSRDTANLALLARPELGITFTKLHCWRLTQYDKCVFLDADTLVLQNCDELFNREELSAAPDVGWPDCFNSGVFVYKPSDETFKAISDFALVHGTFDGGDQGLLNLYFSDWATKDIAKHLPFVYNVVSCVAYSYLPALKQFRDKLKIIHFIGATKPWLQPFDTETGLSRIASDSLAQSQSDFIQLWWNIFCTSVHPSLSANMAGLAGALATVKLGSPLSEEQHALQDHLRRQGWEEGHVDYMGRDSFDNIWSKICETLSVGPSPVPASADLPAPPKPAAETQASAPKEVVRAEARRTSVPKAEKALETLFMKPNTMLQPTSEQADPLTPPPFLVQPQFTPAAPTESKTDDVKVAESAAAPLPPKAESESPALPCKPQPDSPAGPLPPKPQSTVPAQAAEPVVAPPAQAPATPPVQAPATPPAQAPATPPVQAPAAPPAQTPVTSPAQVPETPPAQTPAVPPAQTPAVPSAQTPAVPPPAQAPATPPAQAPATPPVQAPTPTVPTPAPLSPEQVSAASPPAETQTPAPPVQASAPVESTPAAAPVVEPSSAKTPEAAPPAEVKLETVTASQPVLPETPPQSPPQQQETPVQPQPETPKTPVQPLPETPKTPGQPLPETPKTLVQSQPSTPTVTTATPPLSPPPVPSESPVSVTEKLSVQTDIPQTPPVVDAPPAAAVAAGTAPQVVPQASAAPSDEPPIPPKRKGGRGGGDQGKQGRGGGKGGRGKK